MSQPSAQSYAKDALKLLGAAAVGFFLAFGLLLLALRSDLAQHPPAPGEGHVYGLLLPSLEGGLLAALIVLLFIIRRRIRARMLPTGSIE